MSQLHQVQCESLDYTAKGFGASDVQSHQPCFQENVNIKVQEPRGSRKNQSNLKKIEQYFSVLRSSHAETQESSRLEVAQFGQMVLWFCTSKILGNRNWSLVS